MISKEFIVLGKDIKQIPLKVACQAEDVDLVKKYIETETKWSLVKEFDENYLSSNTPVRFVEYLLGFDYDYAFDIFVIKNLYEIQDNKVLSLFLMKEDEYPIPVFCLDSQEIVSNLSDDIIYCLGEISAMREDGLL